MGLGDLTQTLAPGTVLKDSNPIDIEWPPTDMPAFQPGAAHPCPHPFDDEVPFEFGDSSDDDDDGPPQRAASIQVFTEADELDAEVVEFVEHFEEVADGPGDPVRGPDQHHLEAAAAGIAQEFIQTRAPGLGPRALPAPPARRP